MSLCTDPSYTCDEFAERFISSNTVVSITHTKNRISELFLDSGNIVLNQRVRNYAYSQTQVLNYTNYILVFDSTDQVFIDCFDSSYSDIANLSDSYQTIDTEIKYVDLRNDIVVYEKTDVTMAYGKQGNAVLVNVRTSFNDAHLHPFIFVGVPITGTKKLIYHHAGVEEVLHEEIVNRVYGGEINLLMPLFDGGVPYGTFTLDGVTYDAGVVDWYYIPNHMEADGGVDLYWPDWLKAVSNFTDLDAKEATNRWALIIGQILNPTTVSSNMELNTTNTFTGSVAVGLNGDIFLSIQFPTDSTNPTGEQSYKNTLYGSTQSLSDIFNPEGLIYFPVAPIQLED